MSQWYYSLYREPKEDKILHFDYDYKDDYNIIICRQDSNTRRFTMFKSPVDFKKFESSVVDDPINCSGCANPTPSAQNPSCV